MITVLSLLLSFPILYIFKNAYYINTVTIICIGLIFISYLFDLSYSKRFKRYIIPLFTSVVIRLFCLFYDVFTNNPLGLPMIGGPLSSDPLGFFNSAVRFSEGWNIYYGGFFSKLMGIIFRYSCATRLWGEFFVLIFSVGVFHLTILSLEEIEINKRISWISVFLLAIQPNFAFLSVVFRRETIIALFVSCSVYEIIKWVNRGKLKYYIFAIVFVLGASLFHGGTGLIVLSYLFALLLYDPRTGKTKITAKTIAISIFMFAGMIVFYGAFGDIFFSKIEERISEGSVESLASVRTSGGSSYAQYVGNSNSISNMIIYFIPRFVYFGFSPFPWQWRGASDIISFIFSSLFYLYIFIISFKTFRSMNEVNRRKPILFVLILTAMISFIVFSWGVSNTGTAIRHRDKFISLFIVMFAICMEYRVSIVKKM